MTAAWVYVCIGCGLLDQTERRDTITCSTACRVRAHRNGSSKALREAAAAFKIDASGIAQAEAVRVLRPDLIPKMEAGLLELEDMQADMSRAFFERCRQAASETTS